MSIPSKPPPRRFVLPPGGAGVQPSTDKSMVLEAPPQIAAGVGGSDSVAGAVIGLDTMNGPVPDGTRMAAFSRAPLVGEPASTSAGNGLKSRIPGVAIEGGRGSSASSPKLPASGSSGAIFEVRLPPGAATMSAPLRPSSRALPSAIEARFRDRVVYTLVIPKPNLPQYTDDWTLWFAEKNPISGNAPVMRAPVPLRKITDLTASPANSSALEGWVKVALTIGKDGKLGSIVALPDRNPNVAEQAARDLAAWEFQPAARNGQPVEVEVILEVPFRGLARQAQQE